MGEPVRQQILLVLVEVDEISVGDLAGQMELSRSAVSHHLSILRGAGLVRVRRSGTQSFYAHDIDGSVDLLGRLCTDLRACR
jgi:DNA-binding transcriptional ArsR family regulator